MTRRFGRLHVFKATNHRRCFPRDKILKLLAKEKEKYNCTGEQSQQSQHKLNHTSHVAHETYSYQFKHASRGNSESQGKRIGIQTKYKIMHDQDNQEPANVKRNISRAYRSALKKK